MLTNYFLSFDLEALSFGSLPYYSSSSFAALTSIVGVLLIKSSVFANGQAYHKSIGFS